MYNRMKIIVLSLNLPVLKSYIINAIMICIECKNPVKRAFSKYKNDYIRLEVCSICGHVVDKYIEYDNVLVFLDIILLKPQAYRHLCFNVTENELLRGVESHKHTETEDGGVSISSFFFCYKKMARILLMMVLFEVYLLWAYEEKKSHHTLMMEFVLSQETGLQYGIFILRTLISHLLFNVPLQLYFFHGSSWSLVPNLNIPKSLQKPYYSVVLMADVLVANSIKLVPIIMLIWPYDKTLESAKIVNCISMLNVIESLKIITDVTSWKVVAVYGCCMVLREVFCVGILAWLVSSCTSYGVRELVVDNYIEGIIWIRGLLDIASKGSFGTQ